MQQLRGNRLRTFLSLLGICIGIFCIIGVLSAVSSLDSSVRSSMSKLGDDVVYIDKWPWANMGDNWWNYFRRPHPDHEEYELIKEKSRTAVRALYITTVGRRTLKYKSNSASGIPLVVVTEEYDRMFDLELESGRYFSPTEYRYGSPKALIGAEAAEALFGTINPVGKKIKAQGRYFEVIGKIKASGDELFNPGNMDNKLIIPYTTASGFINVKQYSRWNGQIAVKARPGVSNFERLWKEMSRIRNKVAHQATFFQDELDRGTYLSAELQRVIRDAEAQIDKIVLSLEEKEAILQASIDALQEGNDEEDTEAAATKKADADNRIKLEGPKVIGKIALPISEKAKPGFRVITENEIVGELEEAMNLSYTEYVGLKWFVTTFLANKNYAIGTTYSLVNILIEKERVELYDMPSPDGYTIKAIRIPH